MSRTAWPPHLYLTPRWDSRGDADHPTRIDRLRHPPIGGPASEPATRSSEAPTGSSIRRDGRLVALAGAFRVRIETVNSSRFGRLLPRYT
ncbi:hypothetical protein BRD17_05520 [Halobacteriales archaeon SW_7_68_16]|nr:MAG: hypothetical protein BRD17_05520 [Halobacteriales archaeon SW_7_68_16]